ncbi:MAG: proline dehydrogenase family protein [Bacteroidales bacterium]|jgi:proline dehydrogenase
MISFENTEIAFKSKTNKELKRAYYLFKTIGNPAIVKTSKLFTKIALGLHLPIGWAVKPTLYKQFVGGETLEDCKPAVEHLAQYGVQSILDYSVEGGDSIAAIESALKETLRAINFAAHHPNIPFAVFKPTAFAESDLLTKASADKELNPSEKKELEKFHLRIEQLCQQAYDNNIPILIDAEDYSFQAEIDRVVLKMMRKFNTKATIVFNTFQMYRWDRLPYLKELYAIADKEFFQVGAKFVRGAYMEKERERAEKMGYPSPIHPNKEATDKDYNAALKFSMENLDRISIFNGTHNEESSLYLTQLMKEKGISKKDPRIFFSQLYGMSDHISFNLANAGYNVAKYVPYGPVKHVLPYLLRRAEENTSVAGQSSRELNLLKKEYTRRKRR